MRCIRGLFCLWLVVSAPLLGVGGSAQGAFLCWGSDGYVGIETQACESHCGESSDASDHDDHPEHAVCQAEESCGTCIDIPLPSGAAPKRIVRPGGSVSRPAIVAAPSQPEPIAAEAQEINRYCLRSHAGGGDESIACLRTVVLLN